MRANPLASSPRAVPSSASNSAMTHEEPQRAEDVEAAHPDGEPGGDDRLDDGHGPERQGIAEHEVALAERRREQALQRAGRALAQGGDARDEEHHDEREDAEQRGADPVEDVDRHVRVDPGEQPEQHARHDDHEGDGAVVAAQLAQDAARGREGDAQVHAAAPPSRSASSMSARKASSASAAPVRSSSSGSVESLRMRPSRSRSSRSQRTASSMTWLDTSTVRPSAASPRNIVPQVAPQHRVEADGRLVEHEHLGVADEGAREVGPRLLASD